MDAKILGIDNKETGTIKLPAQFTEEVRNDLIKKAVEAIQANKRQKYGASTRAGKDASASVSRRRRKYRGSYGKGISRVPRKVMASRGTWFNWTGAIAPGTVGGRKAHPAKAEKNWEKSINVKERRKAIRSALSATMIKKLVLERGHKVPENYPFIISNDFEKLKTTKTVQKALEKLGLGPELERSEEKKIRAGKGKTRGRKYKRKTGPIVVVTDKCELEKAAKNIPGITITHVRNLNAETLAPGGHPGRLMLMTEGSVQKIQKDNLFN